MSADLNRSAAMPLLTAEQAQSTITKNLPSIDHHDEIVEAIGPNTLRLRLPFKPEYVGAELWQDGAGRVFSGPMVMGLADTAMYCCLMAALGASVIPVMANFNVTFLRPARAADLIADVRIVRRGGRLYYLECWLNSEGEAHLCAHVTSTYRVSRRAALSE
jgi:acyl-coenzyme A thioesterase PaaI-like protein